MPTQFNTLLLVILLSFSTSSFADWFVSTEIKELIKKADAGDKDAQFGVGSAYDFAQGAPKNGEKAKKYYLMAAEQGHVEAQNSLGSGFEAEGNYTEAASWYYKAAQQGHPLAMNSLAIYYIKGVGMPEDKNKGLELYTKAANLGLPQAMYNLGIVYLAGEIVEKDAFNACTWMTRAQTYAIKTGYKTIIDASTQAKEVIHEKYLPDDAFRKCEENEKGWVPLSKGKLP